MHNESIAKTLGVAICVCVVCSVLVSAAAVGLHERQEANKLRNQMENILIAAGVSEDELDKDNEELAKFFNEKINVAVADLEVGQLLADVNPDDINEAEALKDPTKSQAIPAEKDIAGIKRRANRHRIYLMREGGELKRIILPVHGKGLWSTMYGYLTLEGDAKTAAGLDFYEHGETPGLGAEVADNASWKAQWKGKVVFDEEGEPTIEVIKGAVNKNSPEAKHQVDGISGATITCRGVTHLLQYWLGEDGYGPILVELREKGSR